MTESIPTLPQFAVTDLAHPECIDCLSQVNEAISLLRVTGSREVTARVQADDDREHTATVIRALFLASDPDPRPEKICSVCGESEPYWTRGCHV